MPAHDSNPLAKIGEHVFYRSPNTPARAALVGNVDEGAPPDLVVYLQGNSVEMRERWAFGHSVVGIRGRVPHVTEAEAQRSSVWWSNDVRDC